MKEIEFQIDDLMTGKSRIVTLPLEGIPDRTGYTIRLLMELVFEKQDECRVSVRDVGFGEFYPPSGFETEIKIQLGGSNGQFSSVS